MEKCFAIKLSSNKLIINHSCDIEIFNSLNNE